MLQNIKNNHTRILDSKLYNGFYYDYMLYKGEIVRQSLDDINGMAIADFCSLDIASGVLYSTVTWSGATSKGVHMEDIGLTGMDNGLIHFKKDRITNKEFLDLYFNSTYNIKCGDKRLFLTPVTGNTQMYKYPMYLVNDGEEKYISFRGGFYQGFFKLEGFDYQVLPNVLNRDYVFHFDIRPRSDYEVGVDTVNYTHSANTGIFFFMGTRAENKFWPFYKTSESGMTELMKEDAQSEGYFSGCGESGETYNIRENNVVFNEGEWLLDEPQVKEKPKEEGYFILGDGYYVFDWYKDLDDKVKPTSGKTIVTNGKIEAGTNYLNTYDFYPNAVCGCEDCDKPQPQPKPEPECDACCEEYFIDEYFNNLCPEKDNGKMIEDAYIDNSSTKIDPTGESYTDSDGHEFTKRGYFEIETDNKFILFDRTPSGFTTDNWVDGSKVVLYGRKDWPNVNYFLLMDRTPTGYTTETIDQYNEENGIDYNIYKDIRNNVFALRVREDGAIGYKIGALNCDEDNVNHYEVKEEYSKPGIIKFDQWNSINVRFAVINPAFDKCDTRSRKMRMMIYVNGFLVFISKELDTFVFKALDEVYQKQEAVPYNISLGGGSIGLMETILPNYYAISDYILPIERDFCGTFLGDIKCFKIYEGFINYSAIANYLS